jgi:FSR family fosmidomycin resistance protein-like MFS transporter
VAVLAAGHLFTDLNQGAMPALLPFFVAQYRYSYQQAAGLVFAATIASSLVQPFFGHFADRFSAAWLMPAGVLLAGVGLALTAVTDSYWLMAAVLVVSGLGVAAFHPEAARTMNAAAGERKATGMSVFSVGGSAGFALGPLLVTGLMLAFGLRGALLLAAPAAGMAAVLVSQLRCLPALPTTGSLGGQPVIRRPDAWAPFGRLTAALVARSVIYFGFNTFLPLYWVDRLGQSPAAGSAILSAWLASGVAGALIGGRLSDRYGARQVGLWTSLAVAPLIGLFVLLPQVVPATALLLLIGPLMTMPSSGLVVLGQAFLPNRVGVASGITIGLSVSVGGAAAPVLGAVADRLGILAALACLAAVPLLVALLLWTLPRRGAAA